MCALVYGDHARAQRPICAVRAVGAACLTRLVSSLLNMAYQGYGQAPGYGPPQVSVFSVMAHLGGGGGGGGGEGCISMYMYMF